MTTTPGMITTEMLNERVAKSKSLNIVFTAIPEMGHFIPLMRLAAACKEKGHKISFLAFQYNADRCRKMLKQTEIDDVPIEFPDPGYTREEITVGVGNVGTSRAVMFGGTEGAIEPIKRKLQEWKPDLVVSDFMGWHFVAAADELGIPVIVQCPLPLLVGA